MSVTAPNRGFGRRARMLAPLLVAVEVANMGKSPARDVTVQLWVQERGADKYLPVGDPSEIKEIAPQKSEIAYLVWPLEGRNIGFSNMHQMMQDLYGFCRIQITIQV